MWQNLISNQKQSVISASAVVFILSDSLVKADQHATYIQVQNQSIYLCNNGLKGLLSESDIYMNKNQPHAYTEPKQHQELTMNKQGLWTMFGVM